MKELFRAFTRVRVNRLHARIADRMDAIHTLDLIPTDHSQESVNRHLEAIEAMQRKIQQLESKLQRIPQRP